MVNSVETEEKAAKRVFLLCRHLRSSRTTADDRASQEVCALKTPDECVRGYKDLHFPILEPNHRIL